ncbi:hypothetical protein [Streptosporangium sp. H16]|uniref:hypothetical protein n=1 Tax=Streptosporangium sp. H16 TaxID=3444184 RepID=UPI003F79FB48
MTGLKTIDVVNRPGHGVRNRYTASRVVMLLGVYWRIHGDLRSIGGHDPSTADVITDGLAAAWESLQGRRPDTLAAAGYLSLADRLLLRLMPEEMLTARCNATLAELETADGRETLTAARTTLRAACAAGVSIQERRTALEAALTATHSADAKEAIEDSLQVRRLQHLLGYCGVFTVLLLAVSPFLSARTPQPAWAIAFPGYAGLLTVSATLMLVGAVGGLFSRLLQVRDGRTSLVTYRTDMLKLALGPLVGAMAALIVQLLAGWNIIVVLESAGPGGLILLTFAAGFSEKYLLRLLRLPKEAAGNRTRGSAL